MKQPERWNIHEVCRFLEIALPHEAEALLTRHRVPLLPRRVIRYSDGFSVWTGVRREGYDAHAIRELAQVLKRNKEESKEACQDEP